MRSTTKLPLPGKFRDLLVEGNQGQYYSRSEAVMAVSMAMYRAGWSETDYRTEFLNKDENKLAEYFFQRKHGRDRTARWRLAELERIWTKVSNSYSEDFTDAVAVRQEVGLIRARLSDTPLQGRTAVTDTLVLSYIHRIATERGVINPNCSTRDVANACNMGNKTASRALGRLVQAGWIKKEESQGFGKADTYRVSFPTSKSQEVGSHNDTLYLPHGCEDSVSLRDSETKIHETDTSTIMTRGEVRTLSCVQTVPLTPTQIIHLSGSSKATVYRHLKNLVKMGLVATDNGHYTRTSKTLEEAAEDYDAVGNKAKRAEVFEQERKNFHNAEVHDAMAYNYDKDHYGVQVAKQNAATRSRNRVMENEGFDPVTGEILDNYVEPKTLSASVSAVGGGSGSLSVQHPEKPQRPLYEAPERKPEESDDDYESRDTRAFAAYVKYTMPGYNSRLAAWEYKYGEKKTELSAEGQARLNKYRKAM